MGAQDGNEITQKFMYDEPHTQRAIPQMFLPLTLIDARTRSGDYSIIRYFIHVTFKLGDCLHRYVANRHVGSSSTWETARH
jgi:hypothetical protein